MRRRSVGITLLAGLTSCAGNAVEGEETRSRQTEISNARVALLGNWAGLWDNIPDSRLILSINRISSDNKLFGRYYFLGHQPFLFESQMHGNQFSLYWHAMQRAAGVVSFRLASDGEISGIYLAAGVTNRIKMTKLVPDLLGRWIGNWGNNEENNAILMINELDNQGQISGTYSFRGGSELGFRVQLQGTWFRFESGSGSDLVFMDYADGVLRGVYRRSGRVSRITLRRE